MGGTVVGGVVVVWAGSWPSTNPGTVVVAPAAEEVVVAGGVVVGALVVGGGIVLLVVTTGSGAARWSAVAVLTDAKNLEDVLHHQRVYRVVGLVLGIYRRPRLLSLLFCRFDILDAEWGLGDERLGRRLADIHLHGSLPDQQGTPGGGRPWLGGKPP